MAATSFKPCAYELIIDDGDQEQRSYHRTERAALAAWERAANRDDVFTAQVFKRDFINNRYEVIADHKSE